MIARDPMTLIEATEHPDSGSYMVVLNKRTGMKTKASYDAEVTRLIEMFKAAGKTPVVKVYAPGEEI